MSLVKIYKEVKEINKTSVFEDQANIQMNEENPFELIVQIKPKYGIFRGKKIDFIIKLSESYPNTKPSITCKHQIFHPNITKDSICFSMFDTDWSSKYRIEHYINGILWLLSNPNHDSPLNSSAVDNNELQYRLNVDTASRGFQVKGEKYDNIMVENSPIFTDLYKIFIENQKIKFKSDEFDNILESFEKIKYKPERAYFVPKTKYGLIYNLVYHLMILPEEVVKLVFFINSKNNPIIILTNGTENVDISWLKSYLKDNTIRLPHMKEFKKSTKSKKYSISIFEWISRATIIVNQRIEKIPYVYIESGIEFLYFKFSSVFFLKNENFKLADVKTLHCPFDPRLPIFREFDNDLHFYFQ